MYMDVQISELKRKHITLPDEPKLSFSTVFGLKGHVSSNAVVALLFQNFSRYLRGDGKTAFAIQYTDQDVWQIETLFITDEQQLSEVLVQGSRLDILLANFEHELGLIDTVESDLPVIFSNLDSARLAQLNAKLPNHAVINSQLRVCEQGSSVAIKVLNGSERITSDVVDCVRQALSTEEIDSTAVVPNQEQELALINKFGYGGILEGFNFSPVCNQFFIQAQKTPSAIAIVQGDRALTYEKMKSKIKAISSLLLARKTAKSERIGVFLDRSIEASCAMIAVMHSGLVYVPLDVRNPSERTEHIIQSSNISKVITVDRYVDSLNDLGLECIDINQMPDVDVAASFDETAISENDDAYVIYTSGTTGRPKGVVVKHLQFAKQMHGWHLLGYDFNTLRTSSISSYGFDSSFLEHFLALNNGGTLYVFENKDILDTDRLAQLLEHYQIEFTIIPPALLDKTITYLEANHCKTDIKLLLSGGEGVPCEHLKRFQLFQPSMQICVGYGTTEGTINVTTQAFDGSVTSGFSAIGRPMPGYYLLLLDEKGQLVPCGATGQLCITGDVLATGYDSNPDETHKRFITNNHLDKFDRPDRFHLMYQTGDLARYNQCGDLIYQGRMDSQVQIRGIRVELGEVQSAVAKYMEAEAFCTVFDCNGELSIVAYLATKKEHDGFIEGLAKLQKALPGYMLPQYMILLESFPKNVNEKIDKKKLPKPTESDLVARFFDDQSGPAFSGLEGEVSNIVKKVLKLKNIGLDDTFSNLGASSLSLVSLILEVEKHFKVELPMQEVFQSPLAVRSLAEYVKKAA